MQKTAKSKAEERFAAAQKLTKQIQKEQQTALDERAALTAKLRALRLEKEAADAKQAEKEAKKAAAAAKKKTTSTAKKKTTRRAAAAST